jgi:hypothetical protein
MAALAAMLAYILASAAVAHDIPADVRINAFVRPAGQTLELLIRVPLSTMHDVDYPRRGTGHLDVSRADEALRTAAKVYLLDKIAVLENGRPLPPPSIAAARVSLPSDRSFASYERARAHFDDPPLADNLDLTWEQQLLDLLLVYPIASDRSDFALAPRFDRLALKVFTALRFLPPDGAVRAFEFFGDPGLVQLDPRWHQAALSFVISGFWHILDGTDHLLFLLCLVIPFRRPRPLIVIVTAFTVAHSLSLIASAFGYVPDALWFVPLIETLIAATIVYMGLENIVGSRIGRRWFLAFAFGLVHGFGFSFALRDQLQFAGDHLLTSLLAFNVGVEIGQFAVLAVLIPALALLFTYVLPERLGIIILSALVVHTAWHWMIERGAELAKFPLPRLDAAFLAGLLQLAMLVLVMAGALWLISGAVKRWRRADQSLIETPPGEPG